MPGRRSETSTIPKAAARIWSPGPENPGRVRSMIATWARIGHFGRRTSILVVPEGYPDLRAVGHHLVGDAVELHIQPHHLRHPQVLQGLRGNCHGI